MPERGSDRGEIHAEPFLDIPDAEIVEHQPGPLHPPAEPDPALLERSRAQWELGDWDRLAGLAALPLEDLPDRAKLALLAGVGLAQTGDLSGARVQVRRAQDWGCPRDLVARVLVAGVHNSLGRAASLHGDETRALGHFETSIATVSPRADSQALGRARNIHEKARLGQFPEAARLLDREVTALGQASEQDLSGRVAALERTAALLQKVAPARGSVTAETGSVQARSETDMAGQIAVIVAATEDGQGDFLARITATSDRLDSEPRCLFYFALADHFEGRADKLMVLDCLAQIGEILPPGAVALRIRLAREYLRLKQPGLAAEVIEPGRPDVAMAFSRVEFAVMTEAGGSAPAAQEHGHTLLIDYLTAHPPKPVAGRPRLLIEIGTTRERVPGQGSTSKIASLCGQYGMHMITVDMDPHNSELARRGFAKAGLPFEAVTRPGEDYLADHPGPIDYAFLDAYDFDHGKHSQLRQSRYRMFLGAEIQDAECHQMHLKCARALVRSLAPDGLICFDDTWLDEHGAWTAKGTLAMPYLLEHGFEVFEARSRAALLRRRV